MLENYSGATRIIPIFGDPIAQVKAPNGLTRAFEERGRDLIVVPIQVPRESIRPALAAFDTFRNVHGLIATVPHKFAAFQHAKSASERAHFLGSANVLRRTDDDAWHADMLDGQGFVHALAVAGCDVAGRTALLLGAGGAGCAIGYELLDAGAARLAVHDIDSGRQAALIGKLQARFPGRVFAGSRSAAGFDLIANATTSGMHQDDELPIDLDGLRADTFVGDVVTAGEETPLIKAARSRGCGTQTGVGMFHAVAKLMIEFF